MINKMEPGQLERVMEIWLQGNINGHPFIPATHWEEAYGMVKQLLPEADIYVYQESSVISGFIGISEGTYIAGLFVAPEEQGKGIGKQLVREVMSQYSVLSLDVYGNNQRAVDFYRHHGFVIASETMDESTNQIEYHMTWSK